MSFKPDAQLDPGQVQDRRGMGRGGGIAVGGGIGTLIVLAIFLLTNGQVALPAPGAGGGGGGTEANPSSDINAACQTGEIANQREDCRIVGYVNSIQDYWADAFAASNQQYQPADTVLFSDVTQSGCGTASSQVGPFYCPPDQLVFIDLSFFEVLEQQFGAEGGPFAQAYVLAHEYGHHVQNLLGLLSPQGGTAGETGTQVQIELMADCFAGVWAKNAEETGFIRPLTRDDIAQALDAAAAVGDDRIQERTQGQVTPHTWTHGSSEQRQEWFSTGYDSGDPGTCDTSVIAD